MARRKGGIHRFARKAGTGGGKDRVGFSLGHRGKRK